MKKIIYSTVGAFLLLSCSQEKIMFVDNSKLLDQYQEKIELEASLKEKISKYEQRRDSISKAFQTEVQSFEKSAQRLAPAVAQQQYNELMQKSQFLQQQLQQEEILLQSESRSKMDSLLVKIKKFVKDYGQKQGYTFILGANDGGSVHYGTPEKDITEKVVKALNEAYKK